jgi:hypothetical protein
MILFRINFHRAVRDAGRKTLPSCPLSRAEADTSRPSMERS